MNILISNDDGWDAAGIEALAEVASTFGNCTIVAPALEQSGVSHQVTVARPLELVKQRDSVFSLDGTPADCVRIAVTQLKTSFDIVFAGINNGGNLGADVYVSGTVAAAREATLFDLPAIAISQHRLRFGEAFDWTNSKQVCSQVLEHCLAQGLKERELININLPDLSDGPTVPTVEILDPCPLDPNPRMAVYESQESERGQKFKLVGRYRDRKKSAGCDIETCFDKRVPITRFRF